MREILSLVLLLAGAGFMTAGTVGLLRLPDVASRLHALTKADNAGLGLLLAGLAVRADSPFVVLKLILLWLLVALASTTTAQLLAARAAATDTTPTQPGQASP